MVLLFPGGGQTRQSWSGLQTALAMRDVRTLALDLRGHGQSGRAPDGDYALSAYVDDIGEVAGQVARDPEHLLTRRAVSREVKLGFCASITKRRGSS